MYRPIEEKKSGHVYNELLRQKHPYVPKNAPITPFLMKVLVENVKFFPKMSCGTARHGALSKFFLTRTARCQIFS